MVYAIRQVVEKQRSNREVSDELGVHIHSVRHWVNNFKKNGEAGLESKKPHLLPDDIIELERLRIIEKKYSQQQEEIEILKSSRPFSWRTQRNQKAYEAITFLRKEYSVERLCQALGVSKSGYYDYLKRPQREPSERDCKDIEAILRTFNKSQGTYGSKHIAGELKERDHLINHKRVSRLMKELNLTSKIRKARTTREERVNCAGYEYPNLLNRDFNAILPNLKWVMDLSEIKVEGAKLFILPIVDLFNRDLIAFVCWFQTDL